MMSKSGTTCSRPYRRWRCRSISVYSSTQSLLTPGERAFYRVLQQAIGTYYGLSLKTRLADVIQCPDHLWQESEGRRIAQKHLDFVLYYKDSGRIAAAIELDDKSHDQPQRQERDRFIEEALHAAKVKLIRIRACSRYDKQAIADQIRQSLTKPARCERANGRTPQAPQKSRGRGRWHNKHN